MNHFPTAKELAEEARQALLNFRMTPLEHWEWLIREGIIDRQGRVICNKLFGDDKPQAPSDGVPPNGSTAADKSP
jgi:hypothetical protein